MGTLVSRIFFADNPPISWYYYWTWLRIVPPVLGGLVAAWTAKPWQSQLIHWITVWVVATSIIQIALRKPRLCFNNHRSSGDLLVAALCVSLLVMAIGCLGTRHMQQLVLQHLVSDKGGYLWWAWLQEVLMQLYLGDGLVEVAGRRKGIQILAGYFCLQHLPNPLLMALTWTAGRVLAQDFQKNRNLLTVGFVHMAVGLSFMLFLPDAWTGHFLVGRGFLKFWGWL